MAVSIDKTQFGSMTIDGQTVEHDVILRLSGTVKKRKKKLSKRLYGTSHIVSEDEAAHLYEPGCRTLIIGTGQYDSVRLSEETQRFFTEQVRLLESLTPRIARAVAHHQDPARLDERL